MRVQTHNRAPDLPLPSALPISQNKSVTASSRATTVSPGRSPTDATPSVRLLHRVSSLPYPSPEPADLPPPLFLYLTFSAPGKPEDELLPRLLRLEKILSIHFPQYNLADSLGPDYPLPPGFPFGTANGKGKGRALAANGAGQGPSGSYGSEEDEDDEIREEEERERGRGRLTKGKWFGVVSSPLHHKHPLARSQAKLVCAC